MPYNVAFCDEENLDNPIFTFNDEKFIEWSVKDKKILKDFGGFKHHKHVYRVTTIGESSSEEIFLYQEN